MSITIRILVLSISLFSLNHVSAQIGKAVDDIANTSSKKVVSKATGKSGNALKKASGGSLPIKNIEAPNTNASYQAQNKNFVQNSTAHSSFERTSITSSKTPNSNAARREAMRQQKIPTSQQPISQSRSASGFEYRYTTPKSGGGTQTKSVQNQTMDYSHKNQTHWEAGKTKVDGKGRVLNNKHGRAKLKSDKSKVNYR
ncbi:hypothetical protein [uncultured Croceitalea sp.]|uniref:hypothetical protein n=1 Tax=uncultured Croceitalea sp. TaxID=1798908 RepID=UPI0033068EE0